MQNNTRNTSKPKFDIDLSQDKYASRYDRILNILFYAKEIPTDLYKHLNMSHENFRKAISIMKKKGLVTRICRDGVMGYILTAKGREMTYWGDYAKYRDCIDEDGRQYDIKHRTRKRQFAYLYALFDRVGISYETFAKPSITEVTYYGDRVYFYTALDLKRMLGFKSTVFKGSRLMGFLIGRNRIIAVYRTNYEMKVFGRQEAIVPEIVRRCFSTPVYSAIVICDDERAVINITRQVIDNRRNDYRKGINTADYRWFYVFPSDDTFMSHLEDLYTDYSETVERLIEQNEIETSEKDSEGRYRYNIGTGFYLDQPVWLCPGNVNVYTLKYFIYNAERNSKKHYIFCKERDLDATRKIAETMNLRVGRIID